MNSLPPQVPPSSAALQTAAAARTRARWRKRITLAVGILLSAAIVIVLLITRKLPNVEAIRALDDAARVTTLYDAFDRPFFTVFKEERIVVPLEAVSPNIVHAVIAVEDQRFYHHTGIDVVRIGASALADIKSRSKEQGGSTITQQLAKRMFLDDRKTWWRKGREIVLAFRIERSFSKDKILELYLNKVYFGHGFYGIESASLGYFGKSAKDVTLEEAALLAGLIQAPSAYAPQAHPEKAVARRGLVLARMVEAGFLDQASATRLGTIPISLHEASPEDHFARYFKSYVTHQLVQRFGEEAVFDQGLQVYTTLDPDLQRAAERALADGLAKIEAQPKYKHPKPSTGTRTSESRDATPYLQGALVALSPSTGEVRVLIGGRNFDDSSFDRATQAKRQPGSAFKPFIYAAALELGYTPSTIIADLDPATAQTVSWLPNEAHGSTAESMTVRTALRTSSNRAAVRVLTDIGIDRVITYAKRFGFSTPPAVASIALGTSDVSVLSLTAAYAAFANGGLVPDPVVLRRVDDRAGASIFAARATSTPAMSSSTAFLTAQMLADVVNSGTGYRVRKEGFTLPAGGKTGTTDDVKDLWFAGFTPTLAATVWVGFDEPQAILTNGFAGDLAAPIWGRFMRLGMQARGGGWLRTPVDVTTVRICRVSGKLPGAHCGAVLVADKAGVEKEQSMIAAEFYRRGTEPTEECLLHGDAPQLPVSPWPVIIRQPNW